MDISCVKNVVGCIATSPIFKPTVKNGAFWAAVILGTVFACVYHRMRIKASLISACRQLHHYIFPVQYDPVKISDAIMERANANNDTFRWSIYPTDKLSGDFDTLEGLTDPSGYTLKTPEGLLEVGVDDVGCTTAQGNRPANEDTHIIITIGDFNLYAICDGHNGSTASEFVKANLPHILEEKLQGKNGDAAISQAFIEALTQVHDDYGNDGSQSGSTVCAVLRKGDDLWTANLGDTRAVVVFENRQQALSDDADPSKPHWEARVERAGGFVKDGKVGKALAMAAAVGDHHIKGVVHEAEVTKINLAAGQGKATLLIACDGFWDNCSTNHAGDVVRTLRDQLTPQQMATRLVNGAAYQEKRIVKCLADTQGDMKRAWNLGDNITVMVVPLN